MLATMGSGSAARCRQKASFPSNPAACVLAFVETVHFVVAIVKCEMTLLTENCRSTVGLQGPLKDPCSGFFRADEHLCALSSCVCCDEPLFTLSASPDVWRPLTSLKCMSNRLCAFHMMISMLSGRQRQHRKWRSQRALQSVRQVQCF